MQSKDALIKAIHKVIAQEDLMPQNGITYCNIGIYRIASILGCGEKFWNTKENRPMIANEIWEMFTKTTQELNPYQTLQKINTGSFCIAICDGSPHGHVSVCYPSDTLFFSSKWSCDVPLVANIGKENRVMPANWAFSKKPKFYLV